MYTCTCLTISWENDGTRGLWVYSDTTRTGVPQHWDCWGAMAGQGDFGHSANHIYPRKYARCLPLQIDSRLHIEGSFAQSSNTHRPICQNSVLCINCSISGLSWAISDTPLNKWLIRQLAGRMLGILLSTDRITSLGSASSFGLAVAFCRHQLSLMVPVSLPTHVLFCR